MRARTRLALFLTAPLFVLGTKLPAQSPTTIGVVAGVDFATLTGSDADFSSLGLDKGSLTGFLGGVYVDVPLGGTVVLEPQALYIGKGVVYSINEAGASGDITFDLEYIEVPVLLRYNFNPDGGPYALAGMAVGFNVSCSVSGSGDADLPKTDCVDIGTVVGVPFDANSVTFGGIVGIGFQRGKVGLEGRYEFDFSDAYKDSGSIKNAAWEILLRYAVK